MAENKVEQPAKQSSVSGRTKLFGIFRSQSTLSPLLVAIGLLMAFVYPVFLGSGEQGSLGIIVIYFIWIILAESWNLVGGYAGLINLGMVAFFGLGSVVTSIVLTAGLGFGVALVASALVGAVFALILTPTFRLRTDYFAIATLVIPIVLKPIVEYFAGHSNFELPPGLAVNQTLNYEVGVALTAATIFGIYFLMKILRIGMALRGIGDDEFASATVGVNVLLIKTTALVASGVIAAVAGSYYLTYILAVNTSIFLNLTFSLYPIFMVIIGGIGTFEGPIVGALLFSAITYEVNSYFPSSDIEVLIFSVVIMAVAVLLPKGLVPSIRKFVLTRRQRKSGTVVIAKNG